MLWYLAAPVLPLGNETLEGNLALAKTYLKAIREAGYNCIAPWIGIIEACGTDGYAYQLGWETNLMVIERCDGVFVRGPRISDGMRKEMQFADDLDLAVDCTVKDE